MADSLGGRRQALEQTGANMGTRMLQSALIAGIAGTLTLVTATGGLNEVRTQTQAAGQVTQYCAPEQNSDAPDSPRFYCGNEHGEQTRWVRLALAQRISPRAISIRSIT
jgi:hypothetical protein